MDRMDLRMSLTAVCSDGRLFFVLAGANRLAFKERCDLRRASSFYRPGSGDNEDRSVASFCRRLLLRIQIV